MKITFYGVRGSIPTPGKDTSRYGGNTPCTVLESQSGQKLILDAGTGLRIASQEFETYTKNIDIILSHHHWDHIQGFPFFSPIFMANKSISIYPGSTTDEHDNAILEQMTKSYFPVKFNQLPSKITINKLKTSTDNSARIGDYMIESMPMNHPDGGCAYRITCDDKVLVYATDNEISAPKEHTHHEYQDWIAFCGDSDLLIHDAQYIDDEMNEKLGWGHSSISETLTLAEDCNTKWLCLFSHDPQRTDNQLDELSKKILAEKKPYRFFFAKEGLSLTL